MFNESRICNFLTIKPPLRILRYDTKTQKTKEKIAKLDLNKIKTFVHERTLLKGFPGGPVAKTLRSQCRGPGIDPWSGN